MERYPVLGFITRHGRVLAWVVGVLAALLTFMLLHGPFGMLAALAALVVGAMAFALAKSYVELVTLVCDMLVPR